MPTKPTQIRIPPELLARIDQTAADRNLTRTALILEAVESTLPGIEPEPIADLAGELETVRVDQRLDDGDAVMRFKCPSYGCDYEPRSAAARCPVHGRLVVIA